MTDLIYSRNNSDTALTIAEIYKRAPSAFAETPMKGVSERYGHYNTFDAIQHLKGRGYVPVQAAQSNTSVELRKGHTKHFVAFAKKTDLKRLKYHQGSTDPNGRPELVLYNSSDRTSAAKLFNGYFRYICSNSLVAGSGSETKVYHGKDKIKGFEDLIDLTIDAEAQAEKARELMSAKFINYDQVRHLTKKALSLRWKSLTDTLKTHDPAENIKAGSYWTDDSIDPMLRARREDERDINSDRRYSLFDIFNRCQEGLLRGGGHIKTFSNKSPEGSNRRSTGIKSVSESIRLNRDCWDLFAAHA